MFSSITYPEFIDVSSTQHDALCIGNTATGFVICICWDNIDQEIKHRWRMSEMFNWRLAFDQDVCKHFLLYTSASTTLQCHHCHCCYWYVYTMTMRYIWFRAAFLTLFLDSQSARLDKLMHIHLTQTLKFSAPSSLAPPWSSTEYHITLFFQWE